jgi:hypothetical protein
LTIRVNYVIFFVAGSVAQQVEQRTHKPLVVGSIPSATTNSFPTHRIPQNPQVFCNFNQSYFCIKTENCFVICSCFLKNKKQLSAGMRRHSRLGVENPLAVPRQARDKWAKGPSSSGLRDAIGARDPMLNELAKVEVKICLLKIP